MFCAAKSTTMQLELLSVLACLVVTVNAAGCPTGFVARKGSCYWFSVATGSFAEADAYCRYLESHLATIESRDEDLFVRGHARRHGKAHYWLGGTDLNVEGKWMWEGQRRFGFTNWYPRQPDNDGHKEHCLEIRKSYHHYQWNDYKCWVHINFICEKEL